MKRISFIFVIALAVLSSCSRLDSVDGRLDALDTRVAALQASINGDIDALSQAVKALEAQDYIVSSEPVVEGGQLVGYVITFAKSSPVTIRCGSKGEKGETGDNGADGQDGTAPSIGLKKDSDGCWYWTLSGEWLTNSAGERVKAVGADAEDGLPGNVPQLKIEDGQWMVSYDGAATWESLGRANGNDGKDSDPLISSVESTGDVFILTLADGNTIEIPTKAAFDRQEKMVSNLDSQLKAMQAAVEAVTSADYVTSVEKTEEGCTIVFKNFGTVFIPEGQNGEKGEEGDKGHSPQISVAAQDGVWYWKCDGEWMLSPQGEKIAVTGPEGADGSDGIVPLTEIREGDWYVSFDNGENWLYAGVADGSDGDSMFSSIDVSDKSKVVFTLKDGTSLTVPAYTEYSGLDIQFSNDCPFLYPGADIDIEYTVTSSSDNVNVDIFSSGEVQAKITGTGSHNGVIHIHSDSEYDEYSKVVVLVTDGRGIVMKTISFEGSRIVIISTESVNGISADGATTELSFLSNVDYDVVIPEELSWVSVVSTRSMSERTATLRFSKNDSYARSGQMSIRSKADTSCFVTFTVSQKEATRLATQRSVLQSLYNSMGGTSWSKKTGWNSTDMPFESWYGLTVNKSHTVTGIDLHSNNLSGTIPSAIGNLTELSTLKLQNNNITGTLPASFADIMDARGSNYFDFRIAGNRMSGSLPSAILNHAQFAALAGKFLENQQSGYGFTISSIPAVSGTYSLFAGGSKSLAAEYASNRYTLIFRWAEWSSDAKDYVSAVEQFRTQYSDLGLGIIGSYAGGDRSAASSYLSSSVMADWTHIVESTGSGSYSPSRDYPLVWESSGTCTVPFFEIVDASGNIVFISDESGSYSQLSVAGKNSTLSSRLAKLFENVHYESKDYSKDGTVVTLQQATEGNGINIVLMGDAYSDRLIADGTYADHMNTLMEDYFSIEPYTSFRNCFNVYAVNVVSKNEEFFDGNETALSTSFGSGTSITGSHSTVQEYAQKAISSSQLNDALIIVLINREYYAGTCYMYYNYSGDYGRGMAISYFPLGTSTSGQTSRAALTHHEAGGHGFSKLADEYAYTSQGTIPSSEIRSRKAMMVYGWWKNVDFTSDPTEVKWAKFLSDSRYDGQGLGMYEGGLTYIKGVWRPTDVSVMRYNTGSYNAPSRESIYYRIHKLAYGSSWEYDYEDFVTWDLSVSSTTAEEKAFSESALDENFVPLAPPVIIFEDGSTLQ